MRIYYIYSCSPLNMENFKENRKELDEELERFITLLNQLLPHYHFLLKKTDLNKEELNKLGEIEHYLIGVNSKIMEIKGKLEQDLFGQSLDTYYKLKTSAYEGDPHSKLKLEKMRDTFADALNSGDLINYN
ncbi:hypothetical protein OAV26_00160 [Crocinitomicaceae bacterium]|nr:hypothetical protein [Crocinitomicaceae bacterium]